MKVICYSENFDRSSSLMAGFDAKQRPKVVSFTTIKPSFRSSKRHRFSNLYFRSLSIFFTEYVIIMLRRARSPKHSMHTSMAALTRSYTHVLPSSLASYISGTWQNWLKIMQIVQAMILDRGLHTVTM